MSNMSEDIQYAGPVTRQTNADRTDFLILATTHSLYCLGKSNGEDEKIMKSITEGPFQNGNVIQNSAEECWKKLGCTSIADIRATNILLQCIPKDIYTLINHYTDAKDIWDNVKMILEGSELTKDDRES
ncbi:hypothetical protein Tco_1126029 [Tanacetum coccineum]